MSPRNGESTPLLPSLPPGPDTDDSDFISRRKRATWALPLVIIFYFLSYITSVIILSPYLYDKVAEEYHVEYNSTSQHPCANTITNHTEKKIQDEIVKKVTTIELHLSLTSFLFACVPILILGPLTDKYGRKIGCVFPITGTLLKLIVYAIVIGKKLNPILFFIGHICEACGGSFAAMLTLMFSVTSDITTPGKHRSFRITVMEALQTITASAGQFAVGQWIKASYLHPLLYALGMGVIALCLAIFVLPETTSLRALAAPISMAHPTCCLRCRRAVVVVLTACWRMLKKSFFLYYKDERGEHRLSKRRLCMAIFILTVAVNFSKPEVQKLFLMLHPLCWPASWIYTFNAVRVVCNWIAILCIVALLQKVFNMADRHVVIIGVVSSLMASIFMSLAVNDLMVYEVAALSVMIRAIIPMIRSVMSSLVDSTEQGAMYAGIGCVETLGAAMFSVLANRVFYATLSTWPGSVFLMLASFSVLSLILVIILNVLYIREQRRQAEQARLNQSGNIQQEPDPSW